MGECGMKPNGTDRRKSRKRRETVENIVIEIILWAFSITILYPILMVLITSFKSKKEANYLSVSLPTEWHFDNYRKVWEQGNVSQALVNSLIITAASVLLILVFSSVTSYVLVRRADRICGRLSTMLTFGIIAPVAILPTVQLFRALGLYGSRTSLILMYSAIYLPFSVMLYSGFIKGIPRELDEAAVMDGAVSFRLFYGIIFPLLRPVTATTGILTFMWIWNDFQYPLYFLNSSSKWTLPLSVYNFYGQYSRNWNLVCADMVLVSIPIIAVYIFAQKYIISGMTAGAVKG
jgi:raffinose/stachyose/melibiose transport system permease protein